MADEVSLKEYINDKLTNLEKSVDARFKGVEATTKSALDAADRAVSKAEAATEKRFEGVNEFRATLSDQASKFIIRSEFELVVDRLEQDIKNLVLTRGEMVPAKAYDAAHKDLQKQVEDLKLSRANLEGRASQSSVYIAYLFSAIGVVMGIIGLLR